MIEKVAALIIRFTEQRTDKKLQQFVDNSNMGKMKGMDLDGWLKSECVNIFYAIHQIVGKDDNKVKEVIKQQNTELLKVLRNVSPFPDVFNGPVDFSQIMPNHMWVCDEGEFLQIVKRIALNGYSIECHEYKGFRFFACINTNPKIEFIFILK